MVYPNSKSDFMSQLFANLNFQLRLFIQNLVEVVPAMVEHLVSVRCAHSCFEEEELGIPERKKRAAKYVVIYSIAVAFCSLSSSIKMSLISRFLSLK